MPPDAPIGAFREASWRVGPVSNPSTLDAAADARAWLARFDNVKHPTLACFTYDLGRVLEPAAGGAMKGVVDRKWPLAFSTSFEPQSNSTLLPPPSAATDSSSQHQRLFSIGTPISNTSQGAFEHAVERALEYIRAGDIYQVNLAHRFSASFRGCPRTFFAALANVADPAHGAYLEHVHGDTALIVASASPELFLDYNASSRTLRTRPMKGTRPAHGAMNTSSRDELLASTKDQAELAMIVDLMRNDLGKVCDLASVRVEQPRQLETHGSRDAQLFQTTATIAGSLRAGTKWSDIFSATFPGGSITGAPKIRAMQVIEELETRSCGACRGPYCGSIGLWRNDGSATLNIAIRTACITGTRQRNTASQITEGVLDWWVGAGIVADSNPSEEWRETLAKAAVFMRVLGC